MAAPVNVRFVISLAVVVCILFGGVAAVFTFVKLRSGERYVRMGDEAMARHDYDAADTFYGRAVGRESGNVEWLRLWKDARERRTPETESTYMNIYNMYVGGILHTIARVERTNVEAHREHLEAIYQDIREAPVREAWDALVRLSEDAIAYFDDPPVELRRYRGLAIAGLLERDLRAEDHQLEQAREDLEAALRLDPTDATVARGLAIWHRAAAARTLRRETTEREHHLQTAQQVIDDLLAAAPNSPAALIEHLMMRTANVDLIEDASLSPEEVTRRRTRALQELRPHLSETHQRLLAADPDDLPPHSVQRYYNSALRIAGAEGAAMTQEVIDHALTASPESAELLWLRAQALLNQDKIDECLAQFEAICDLPNLPISREGRLLWIIRPQARFMQANIATDMAIRAADPQTRSDALRLARQYREELVKHIQEGSPELLFIDGKMRFVDGDIGGAQRTLNEYIRMVDSQDRFVPEALLLLAECAIRRNTPGLAREHLQRVRELRPTATESIFHLARMEAALQNHEDAEQLFQTVLAQNPDHEGARAQLQRLRAEHRGGRLEDPVEQLLVDAQRLAQGSATRLADDDAAIALLRRSLAQHDHDPRLVSPLVQLKLAQGDTAGAQEILETALRHHPEDRLLRRFQDGLQAASSLEASLEWLDGQELPEVDRLLREYQIYISHGKEAEATDALERAARAAPEDARVVEMQFLIAIGEGNLERAEALADRATRLDLDRAEGDTFQARLQIARNELQQAAITLERAVERGNVTAHALLLLGRTQLALGRQADAISTLRRALELSPMDLATIKALMSALAQTGQVHEALAVARASETHARRDLGFMNAWMALESSSGNVAFARERREQIMQRHPEDAENLAALAQLYISEQRFDRARQLIDRLKRTNNSLGVVNLDAHWHASRGNLQEAQRVFVNHIAQLRDQGREVDPGPYLALGQFLLRQGQTEEALAAMREAARYQDSERRPVDVEIGNVLIALGRLAEAEQKFRELLDAGVHDQNHTVRRRLVDVQLQRGRFAEASRTLEAIGTAVNDDVELLSLQAEAARGLGDHRRARELFDRAVSRFPDEPTGYLHRARMLMSNPDLSRDALADLSTVLRLRPGMWQALHMRAAIHFANNRVDDALRDLVAASEANAGDDNLRIHAIAHLLEHGREERALEVARAGAALRAVDRRLLTGLGDTFAQRDRWRAASQFYRDAWQISPSDEGAAIRYARSLINAAAEGQRNDPLYAEAERVLATPALNADRSLSILMTRAALRQKQGQRDTARADALQAFSLVGEDPRLLVAWHEHLVGAFPEPSSALAVLDSVRLPAVFDEWRAGLRGMIMIHDESLRSEGVSLLRKAASEARNPSLRVNMLRILSSTLTVEGQWEEALEATRTALEVVDGDPALNNNAAYLLFMLGRYGEGLPYAEKAVSQQPNHRSVLDTLGSLQWALDRQSEAIATLGEALRVSRSPEHRIETALKRGGWMLEAGDYAGAAAMARTARETLTDMGERGGDLRSQLTDFERQLERSR